MFTKNWFNLFKNYFASTNDSLSLKGVNTKGQEKSLYAYNTHSYLFPSNVTSLVTKEISNTDAPGVFFGDGDTPPTEDDYTLSGSQVTTLVARSTNSVSSVEGNDVVHATSYFLENTGTTEVTIKEVAWVSGHRTQSNLSHYFMLDRTLLDSPVTIEPGGVAKITYTRRLTIPTE